jgi:hypothetical protein
MELPLVILVQILSQLDYKEQLKPLIDQCRSLRDSDEFWCYLCEYKLGRSIKKYPTKSWRDNFIRLYNFDHFSSRLSDKYDKHVITTLCNRKITHIKGCALNQDPFTAMMSTDYYRYATEIEETMDVNDMPDNVFHLRRANYTSIFRYTFIDRLYIPRSTDFLVNNVKFYRMGSDQNASTHLSFPNNLYHGMVDECNRIYPQYVLQFGELNIDPCIWTSRILPSLVITQTHIQIIDPLYKGTAMVIELEVGFLSDFMRGQIAHSQCWDIFSNDDYVFYNGILYPVEQLPLHDWIIKPANPK